MHPFISVVAHPSAAGAHEGSPFPPVAHSTVQPLCTQNRTAVHSHTTRAAAAYVVLVMAAAHTQCIAGRVGAAVHMAFAAWAVAGCSSNGPCETTVVREVVRKEVIKTPFQRRMLRNCCRLSVHSGYHISRRICSSSSCRCINITCCI